MVRCGRLSSVTNTAPLIDFSFHTLADEELNYVDRRYEEVSADFLPSAHIGGVLE
jgi:hypothetical protein